MPHVSKKRVKKEVFKKMGDEFVNSIASLKVHSEIKGYLNELLTPTERIMLAKRLAIILMLRKGYPFNIIERTLKLSPSTVARFWKLTKTKTFQFILKEKKRKEEQKKFWDELEKLLRIGMPPCGKGRWAKTLRLLEKE